MKTFGYVCAWALCLPPICVSMVCLVWRIFTTLGFRPDEYGLLIIVASQAIVGGLIGFDRAMELRGRP